MKRLIAFVLAVAMSFSIVMPSVAAAYESSASGSGSISAQESASISEQESAEAESASSEAEAEGQESASAGSSSEAESASSEEEKSSEPAPKADKSGTSSQGDQSARPDRSGSDVSPETSGSGDQSAEASADKSTPETSPDNSLPEESSARADLSEALSPNQKTLKKTLQCVDGVRYTITLTYDESAELPDGTKLSLVEVNRTLTAEEQQRKENKKRPYSTERFVSEKALEQDTFDLREGLQIQARDYVLFTKFLDLNLTHNGKTVQPKAPVIVTVETDAVQEGASDALELAYYDKAATKEWKKELKRLRKEREARIKAGKVVEVEQRMKTRVFTALEAVNQTQKGKGVKLSFQTQEFNRLGVAAVASELESWREQDETVSVYGPRHLKAKVRKESMKKPEEGLEQVQAFSVVVDERPENTPDYDVTFWVGANQARRRAEDTDLVVQSDEEEPESGLTARKLKNGKAGAELIGPQSSDAPVSIRQGDGVALLWDTGLRKQSVEAENVSVEGLLPKNAQLTANDMLWRYSRPEEIVKTVSEDAETLAAYDITISGRQGEFQPGDGKSVSVTIQNEGISSKQNLEVWHLSDNGEVEVLTDLTVKDGAVSFDATGFSVYMVVQVSKEQTVTASDGKTYKITVTYDSDAGIPENAELQVSELDAKGKDYQKYVKKAAKKLETEEKNFAFAHAFDIALVNPATGERYQPAKNVKVSVKLLGEDVGEESNVGVVHFGDETQVLESSVNGDAVEFETNGFSVYVIIEHEGDTEVKTPRVEFHFIDSDIHSNSDSGYESLADGQYQAAPFRFINKAKTIQTSQILKDGESLEMIANPPNLVIYEKTQDTAIAVGKTYYIKSGNDTYSAVDNPVDGDIGTYYEKIEKYFYGWYVVNGEISGDDIVFTWTEDPDEISFDKNASIHPDQKTTQKNGEDAYVYLVDGVETAYTSSETVPQGATPVYLPGNVNEPVHWEIDGVSGDAELDAEGTAHVFLAPVYEDYYFINYRLGPKDNTHGLTESLLVRKLVVLGNDEKVSVRIGGVTGVSPDAKHQVFSGWESVNDGPSLTRKYYYQTVDSEGNERNYSTDEHGTETANTGGKQGYYATFTKADFSTDRILDLYPVFVESRWLYFNTGKSGNGATYVAAAYRLTNEGSNGTYFDNDFFQNSRNQTRRNGYSFEGWYVNAKQDANGEITNLDQEQSVEIKIVDDAVVAAVKDEHDNIVTPATVVTGVTVQSGSQTDSSATAAVTSDGVITVTANLKADKLIAEDGEIQNYELKVEYTIGTDTNTVTLFKVETEGGNRHLYFYKPLDDLTVYALWKEIEDTTIQVNVWRQKVSDDKSTTNTEHDLAAWLAANPNKTESNYIATNGPIKTYDYVKDYSGTVSATSDRTLEQLRSANKLYVNGTNVETLNEKGFHLRGDSVATATFMNTTNVRGDGSTVVDVYYDRKLITFDFYTYNDPNSFNYTETTSNAASPDQYAFVDGTAVKLDRQETPAWLWTPEFTYSVADTSNTTAKRYALVNGEYVELTLDTHTATEYYLSFYENQNGNNEYTGTVYANNNGYVGGVVDNPVYPNSYIGRSNNSYYYLYWNTRTTTTYTWQLNGTDYDGTHYTRESGGSYTGTVYTRSGDSAPYTYTSVTDNDNDPIKYGVDRFGGHVKLNGANGTIVTWLAPVYAKEYYANANGEYGKIDDEYVPLEKTLDSRTYQRTDYTYTYTTSNSGDQYGVVNGNIQQVYRNNNNWRLTDNRHGTVYSGYRYTRSSPSTNADYTDQRYKLISGTAGTAGNNQSGFQTASEVSGDNLFGKDGNNDTYFQLQVNETYSYSYNGQPYTGNLYSYGYHETGRKAEWTGTRYTRTATNGWGLYKQFTGLYGQTLEQNGYKWDENYFWWSSYSSNQGSGTRTTFLDAFLPTSDTQMVEFYGDGVSGDKTIYFYKQNINANGYELVNPVASSNSSFNLSDKYNGFTCYGWKKDSDVDLTASGVTRVGNLMDNNGQKYYDADPSTYGYQTASFTSSLHIYFNRNQYKLTFVTQYPNLPDLWDDWDTHNGPKPQTTDENYYQKTVTGIPYDSDLSSYGSDGANYWQPSVPPHYTFTGWYEDVSCTKAFNFNSKMPSGDKILYAGWKAEKFRVEIDPNGAEIDHINHKWDNASDDLSKKGYAGYWWTGDRWGTDPNAEGVTYSASDYTSSWVPFATFNRASDSGYRTDQSTYINASYNEMVGEYTVTRDYVPMSDAVAAAYAADGGTVYYYINTQFKSTDGSSLPSDLRNALYVTEAQLDQYYNFYRDWVQANLDGRYITGTQLLDRETWQYTYVGTQKYRAKYPNEHYEFLGWYRVFRDENGNETGVSPMPYNFSDPVREPLILRAYWRLDGGYRMLYTPQYVMSDGTIINGDLERWEDPKNSSSNYADNAKTEVLQQPTGLTANGEKTDEYIFRGWRLVSMKSDGTYTALENGVYYQPGEHFTINAAFADKNGIIRMQAVYEAKDSSYRRPYITNLTLDAKGGFLTQNGTDQATGNFDLTDTWTGVIGTIGADVTNNRIEFGDIQTEEKVHLYRWTTELTHVEGDENKAALNPAGKNYFKHPDGYFLLGFDENNQVTTYRATYPADSVIAVTRNDDKTLYAVWEPMVYLNFVNNTPKKLTFSLRSTQGALTIVNAKHGLYGRTAMTAAQLEAIEIEPGETLMFAAPNGAEKTVQIGITNDLGIGQVLTWDTSLTVGDQTYNTVTKEGPIEYPHTSGDTHTLAKGQIDNTQSYTFAEKLIVNPKGLTVTFDDKENDFALVLESNFEGGGYQEFDFSTPQVLADNPAMEKKLPQTSTRPGGYQFLGWGYTAASTEAEYSSTKPAEKPWYITDLNTFFNSNASVQKKTIETTDPDTGETHTLVIARLYAVWTINKASSTVFVYNDVPEPGNQTAPFAYTLRLEGQYTWTYSGSTYTSNLGEDFTFELCHGEHAVLVSENITKQGYIQTKVTIYNADDTVKTPEVTYRVQAPLGQYGEGGSFGGTEKISVTQKQVANYDVTVARTAQTDGDPLYVGGNSNATTIPLTENSNTAHWTSTFAGGTLYFTNTRKTADISVKKVLESNTEAPKQFNFTAGYTLKETINGTEYTTSEDLGAFAVTSGSETGHKLVKIPVGAQLTVTELGTDLCDYTVTATQNGTPLSMTESADSSEGVTTYTRAVTYTVDEGNTDITYKNALKFYKVTFYKVDQNGNAGVPSYFKLSSEYGLIGQDLYPTQTGTGQFYPIDKLYAGEYTLEETFTSSNYMGLEGPVTLKVTGAGGADQHVTATTASGDEAKVLISGNETEGYQVRVYNIRTVNVSIAKVMNDPILSTSRIFHFDVSYQYKIRENQANEQTVQVKLTEETAVEVESGETTTLKVPLGATGLRIAEDTTRLANATDTIAQTYDTKVQYNNATETNEASYTFTHAIADSNNNDTITFTNTRKTVNVSISKTVIADDTGGDFTFEVYVLNGALPIKNYTVNDCGTVGDASDDWVTDNTGLVKLPGDAPFTLSHGGAAKTVKIPVGATITVEEKLTPAQEAKGYAVFMTMPGRKVDLVDGRADKVKIIGPTEDREIHVYNIPSICKVTDASGNLLYVLQEGARTPDDADDIYIPAIFPTIKGAFEGRRSSDNAKIGGLGNYYQKDSTTKYDAKSRHNIEMLVDYQVPNDDVVVVDSGHDMVFTTAKRNATDGYPFRRAGEYSGSLHENGVVPSGIPVEESVGRAVLLRAVGSNEAFFTISASDATQSTTFKMSDLIIDGKGAQLNQNVRGGCLTAYKSDVTIDNCVVYNFEAAQGGAIYTTGDSLTVKDSVFDTCKSDLRGNGNGGGAINTEATTLSVTGTTQGDTVFKNCSGVWQGGAVYHYGKDKSTTLTNCLFEDCTSRSGGAVEADTTTVSVNECVFKHCTAIAVTTGGSPGGNAGGLNNYLGNNNGETNPAGSSLTVTNCTFQGCSSDAYGGGLRSKALTVTLTGCTFEDTSHTEIDPDTSVPTTVVDHNKAKYGGSAVFDNTASSVNINGCTFTNCSATESGGGIYSKAASLTVQNNGSTATTITSCSAKNGGGIYLDGSAQSTLTGSTKIERCSATNLGGGVYVNTNAKLTMSGSAVIDGKGSGIEMTNAANGGGVYVNNGTLELAEGSSAAIQSCIASANGGGIFTTGASARVNVKGGSITSCSANNGGGIYLDVSAQSTLTGSTKIERCSATNLGGGVYVNTKAKLTMSGSAVIDGNGNGTDLSLNATKGGGVYVKGELVLAKGSSASIRECKVSDEGGAIFVDGSTARVNIHDGTISANQATGWGGGAIRVINGLENNATDENNDPIYNVTISGGTISGNSAVKGSRNEVYGGAVNIKKGTILISGGEISNNYVKNDDGSFAMGGAIHLGGTDPDSSKLTLTDGTISANYVTSVNKPVFGGAVSLRGANAKMTMSDASITGNYATSTGGNKDTFGGAICVYENAAVDLSGGTISGNYVQNTNSPTYAKGAGIYLAYKKVGKTTSTSTADIAPTTLYLSGDPHFGTDTNKGADTENSGTYSFTEGSNIGNCLTTELTGQTNGSQSYTKARQDIYLAGYSGTVAGSLDTSGTEPTGTGIVVTNNITSGVGAIWVWAEENDHIHKDDQFGFHVADTVSEASLSAFRNARVDTDTGASSAAYYGVKSTVSNQTDYVIWGTIGGADVSFKKVDGFGDGLGGAQFTLYKTLNDARNQTATKVVPITGEHVTSNVVSSVTKEQEDADTTNTIHVGDVSFRAPVGIWYMKETTPPTGYKANDNVYIVLVGNTNVTVPNTKPTDSTSVWSAGGILGKLAENYNDIQDVVNAQRGAVDSNGKYERDSAVFLIENTGTETTPVWKAVATPNIATYGIVNHQDIERMVILDKINKNTREPLPNAEFDLLSADHSVTQTGLKSGKSINGTQTGGAFYVGMLPLGKYYLHEKKPLPSGYAESAGTGADGTWWWTLELKKDGTITLTGPEPTEPDTP